MNNINFDVLTLKDKDKLGLLVARINAGDMFLHTGVNNPERFFKNDLLGAFTDDNELVGFSGLSTDPEKLRRFMDRLKLTEEEYRARFKEPCGEHYFMVRPDFVEKGLGTELCNQISTYAKEEHDLWRLFSIAHPDNKTEVVPLLASGHTTKPEDLFMTICKEPKPRLLFQKDLAEPGV
ncbi:MAG: GNAT family N-acetyltransferase [Firmicutes bacterium]|nr:GNAT family N-acetyltransferase [Bacillota bacterium]